MATRQTLTMAMTRLDDFRAFIRTDQRLKKPLPILSTRRLIKFTRFEHPAEGLFSCPARLSSSQEDLQASEVLLCQNGCPAAF